MEMLTSILNQGLGYIVPMIILLGLLIFVHELGHFLAAKFYKVRVETFSLGFGPKILKFIHNGTVYCVSALPLGGYVKMFGDEPGREVSESDRAVSYLHKPVGQRIVIVLAGPLMNLFFAAFLFYWIAWIGDKAVQPSLGEIPSNSEAYAAGFRSYDQILTVDGEVVRTWDQISEQIESSPGREISFTLQRGAETVDLRAQAVVSPNDNLFSTADQIGKITGLTPNLHLPVVGVVTDSAAQSWGLRTGDHILKINGESVSWFRDLQALIQKQAESQPTLEFEVHRFSDFRKKDQHEKLTFKIQANQVPTADDFGFFIPDTVIAEVQDGSPAQKAGIKRLDQILLINKVPIISFDDIVKNVSAYAPGSGPLQVTIQRQGQKLEFSLEPEMNTLEGQFGETENRYTIGVIPVLLAAPNSFVWKSESVGESLQRASQQTWHWSKVTLLSFVRILQNRVSSKNVSGIISIGQVAQQSWSLGLNAFLKIMAIISINLFILNLLPIPILDGGHLVLFSLEAIKGSPVSLKKVEVAQQVGFLILLFLMAFALFNDFSRIFGS